jgi:hypothetical protein
MSGVIVTADALFISGVSAFNARTLKPESFDFFSKSSPQEIMKQQRIDNKISFI